MSENIVIIGSAGAIVAAFVHAFLRWRQYGAPANVPANVHAHRGRCFAWDGQEV